MEGCFNILKLHVIYKTNTLKKEKYLKVLERMQTKYLPNSTSFIIIKTLKKLE